MKRLAAQEQRRGRGLSLWWLPPRSVSERLQGIIDALAGRLGTPSFTPHVTVEGGLSDAPEHIAGQLATAPEARLTPLLTPLGLSTQPSWSRTLVQELEPTPQVIEARTAVCTALGRTILPGSFRPHLSLAYGPLPQAIRERICDALRVDTPAFHPVSLALVDTSGPVPEWWEIQRWPLVGGT